MTSKTLLIGDIGGTNARFALADEQLLGYSAEKILKCADFATAEAAIRYYLNFVNAPTPQAICLAAAGAMIDQQVQFTNNSWEISATNLRIVFGIEAVRLLNDFEAIAYCVPLLSDRHLMSIGLPDPKPLCREEFLVGVIGPGTGLGAVGVQKSAGIFKAIPSEAGHVGFAAETQVQIDILTRLRRRFDRVSAERLASGPGLENIYWALCGIHGDKYVKRSAAEVFAAALKGGDSRATEAVETFFEILGQVAGDLALTLCANDGIYVCGGVAQRHPEKLANSRFRSGFEGKGRHRTMMERIPTQLIVHEQPGLLGAMSCVCEMN